MQLQQICGWQKRTMPAFNSGNRADLGCVNILHHPCPYLFQTVKLKQSTFSKRSICLNVQRPGLNEHYQPALLSQPSPYYWGFLAVVCRAITTLSSRQNISHLPACGPACGPVCGRQLWPPNDDKSTSKTAKMSPRLRLRVGLEVCANMKRPFEKLHSVKDNCFLAMSLIGRVALNVLSCQTCYAARIYESGWTFKTHMPQKDQGRRCIFLLKNESTQGGCTYQKQTSGSPGSLSWERLDFLIKQKHI